MNPQVGSSFGPVKIALLAGSPGWIPALFLERNLPRLREAGVEVGVIVLDDFADQREPRQRLTKLARRQAKVAGCSVPTALARLLFYERVMKLPGGPIDTDRISSEANVVHVPSLNSAEAVQAVRDAGCDLVSLMGARFLTRKTLQGLAAPIFNIHSSDPRFVRGGPVVFWEVLAGRPTIELCVHEVVEQLDSGAIRAQGSQDILYEGGIGATTRATMLAAKPVVTDLFENVIRQQLTGALTRTAFEPGPLRTTPSIRDTVRVEALCRARTRAARARRPAVA